MISYYKDNLGLRSQSCPRPLLIGISSTYYNHWYLQNVRMPSRPVDRYGQCWYNNAQWKRIKIFSLQLPCHSLYNYAYAVRICLCIADACHSTQAPASPGLAICSSVNIMVPSVYTDYGYGPLPGRAWIRYQDWRPLTSLRTVWAIPVTTSQSSYSWV